MKSISEDVHQQFWSYQNIIDTRHATENTWASDKYEQLMAQRQHHALLSDC